MADESEKAVSNDSLNSKEAEKPQIQPISLPTAEEIRGQDIWNNCAVKSVASGVMGMLIKLSLSLFHFSRYLLASYFISYIDCIKS
jgi:import inner membrane translocase subunit TIM22